MKGGDTNFLLRTARGIAIHEDIGTVSGGLICIVYDATTKANADTWNHDRSPMIKRKMDLRRS